MLFSFIIEMIGALACAISGIRLAALKRFDWFGAYIVGLVTALGGGTLRDAILCQPAFWVADFRFFLAYFLVTLLGLILVVVFRDKLVRRERMLLIFDAIGLAMFTVIGIEKALDRDCAMGVCITMGMLTGAFGGVLRDILLNRVPLIFRKDIYAMASLLGGIVYWLLLLCCASSEICAIGCLLVIVTIRMLAVKFGWHLPILTSTEPEAD
ncbi:MAG: trimeric intracellular cation channel family protein [Bacteroides sp.]|nr:trimeric intracellular cation channel family protein [Bacteroides sp.]MCM1379177.1 trimeric intracellular cation channel family protein [Bacteroides sp.]MCM1445174.1 trimeric intracellular cation channel family protein [Prevotella sp.]